MIILVIILALSASRFVTGNFGTKDLCYPKLENHTLCHGSDLLDSVKNFADLLRHSKSGYSVYHSNIWIMLMHTKCHTDLEKLLCAVYAPTCLKGHHFTRIYPCPELCESVMEKCLPRMKVYGFEWPSMVNCQRFRSQGGGDCIQLSNKSEYSTKESKVKRQREDRSLNNTILSDEEERNRLKNCKICHRKVSFEVLAKRYCDSTLVIKAKIVQIFTRRKNHISLRLHHKSKVLASRQPIKGPLNSLMTEIQCSCPLLQGQFLDSRWLLFGDIENGQFTVKFATKWRRKHSRFRYLIKSLRTNPESNCKSQKQLLRSVYKKSRSRRSHRNKGSN